MIGAAGWRRAALALHAALAAGIVAAAHARGDAWLALPLAAPLPGMLKGRAYTYAWASMLLVFYAGGYLSAAMVDPARRALLTGIAAIAAMEFVCLVLYVRLTAREKAATAAAPPAG